MMSAVPNKRDGTNPEDTAPQLRPEPQPTVPRRSRTQAQKAAVKQTTPGQLWNRATLTKHLKLAGDVRVYISALDTSVTIVKQDLIRQIQAAPVDALFPAPKLEFHPRVGLIMILR